MPATFLPSRRQSFGHLIATPTRRQRRQRPGDRDGGREGELWSVGRRETGPQDEARVQVHPCRRNPLAAEPPAPVGLTLGQHERAFGRAVAGEARRLDVGRVDGLEALQAAAETLGGEMARDLRGQQAVRAPGEGVSARAPGLDHIARGSQRLDVLPDRRARDPERGRQRFAGDHRLAPQQAQNTIRGLHGHVRDSRLGRALTAPP